MPEGKSPFEKKKKKKIILAITFSWNYSLREDPSP